MAELSSHSDATEASGQRKINVRNGWKAAIRNVSRSTVLARTFLLLTFSMLTGCYAQPKDGRMTFSVKTRYLDATPTVVFITVKNLSSDYLCFSSGDLRLGSDLIHVFPPNNRDNFENRSPPDLIAGLDVREGIRVVPPKSERDFGLDISNLEGRQPKAAALSGYTRGVACDELFGSPHPTATRQAFAVNLEHPEAAPSR